jgi:hypothetical protein
MLTFIFLYYFLNQIIMRKILLLTISCWLCCTSFIKAQKIDELYNEKIKEYTTDPRFLPKSVLDLIDHPQIPSPRKFFGHIIGAEGELHRSNQIYNYYQKLAETSAMVKMQQMGTSEEGRPMHVVIIGREKSLQRLDHYKSQLAKLADPRKFKQEDLDQIIIDSKPIYYISGGMHATEMGSPEMLMELAYRLVTSQTPEINEVLDNLIVIINPISEPDGLDKQVDWYYRYSKSRTVYDDGFPRSAPYWGKYVFHDNNRDGLQLSQEITKSIYKAFYEFHPTVMLDLHESVPLLYISTGTGPYNEYVDPITIAEWQIMANHDIATLASQGLPGAFTWAFYDGWWPGYGIWVANNHNSNGRFYETYGNAGANTYLRDLSNDKYAGDPATTREWYRPDPPTQQVNWSFRNNINYTQAGVLASLTYAAKNPETLLRNFYQKGVNSIQKGKNEKPSAFLISKNQRDPAMVAYLVNQLRGQAIEVHENSGEYVVLLDQPYRNLAVNLLTKQNYPKDAKFPPYDGIAWTLSYLNGVDVIAKDSIDFDKNQLQLLNADAVYAAKLSGDGNHYYLKYQAQNTVLPALFSLKKSNKNAEIFSLKNMHVINGDTLLPGSLYFSKTSDAQIQKLAQDFSIDFIKSSTAVASENLSALQLPRVAIYHTWYNTQDEGWSRFTFEKRGIPYTSIDKDDLKAGNLKSKFDVILIPRTRGTSINFVQGVDKKFGPMPYTKTPEFPSHGLPAATNDMTGGPGFLGMENLQKFMEEGGLLITMDNSTAIIANVGITNALQPVSANDLFHPGSIIQAKVRNTNHPVFYGYPEYFPIYRGNAPLLQVGKYDNHMMLLQYGTKPLKSELPYEGPIMGLSSDNSKNTSKVEQPKEKDMPYVLSGMVRNEHQIIGHGGIFQVPIGKGNLLGFTFDPLHRYLNHHDAPMVWNALMHWNKFSNK